MDWVLFGIGIIYAILSKHYIAQGIRKNIISIGQEVVTQLRSGSLRIM